MDGETAYPELSLSPTIRCLLNQFDFDLSTFLRLQAALKAGHAGAVHNRLTTPLQPPQSGDVLTLPPPGSAERERLTRAGEESIARGEVCAMVLAGGMATRFGGGAKACAEAVAGASFLQLKLRDVRRAARRAGGVLPLYVMTSFATDSLIKDALAGASRPEAPVATFAQSASLRLTPEGELFRERDGGPSVYAPGHGDFGPALQRAGLLRALRAAGVRYVVLSNIDNLAATLEPALLGLHATSGTQILFEVVQSGASDVGGVPARVAGQFQVVEGFRQPRDFDPATIPLFSTNCFVFTLDALSKEHPLSWFAVEKRVDGRPAVQFERLVNQLTAFVPSRAALVARVGDDNRFIPVKDRAELDATRPSLLHLLESRGVLAEDSEGAE